MQETPIHEVPCAVLDTVLLGAFCSRELADLLRASGVEVDDGCARSGGPCVTRRAHEKSHVPGTFAARLQRQLDYRFAEARRLVARSNSDEVGRLLESGVDSTQVVALAWAVCRDGRDDVKSLGPMLALHAQQAALTSYLAGTADFPSPSNCSRGT